MRRREVIVLLGGGGLAWPLAARAQQANKPFQIGFMPLGLPTNASDRLFVEAFRKGLQDVGLIESRDVTIDITWVANESDYSRVVSELLQRGAMLLVTGGSTATAMAQRHTSTIPIIFAPAGNPVGTKFVASLSHPGGNITGFSDVLADLSGKYVQFGIELGKPHAPIDYLWHTEWPDGKNRLDATTRAAQSFGVELRARGFAHIDDANDVLAAMKNAGAVAIVVQPSPLTNRYRGRLIESGMAHGLGMIMAWPVAARADRIWPGLCRHVSPGGLLCSSHHEGREAGKPPCSRADEVPLIDQHKVGESDWRQLPSCVDRRCGRSN
jgi:ABC transporter substrate binding protein